LFIDEHLEEIIENVINYIQSPQTFADLMTLIQYFDTLILNLPIDADVELIQLANSSPIREQWYNGVSINEIEKLGSKAIDVCNKYYGFHFPWIINAISKKMNLNNKPDEATILENISLFSEIGVHNIESAKVYLAGVKSRECSLELSSFINIDTEFSVKEQLFDIFRSLQSGEISCSEKSHRWLTLLDLSNKSITTKTFKKIVANISEGNTGNYDELFVKYYNNKIYLCSYDYKVKLLIRDKYQDKYKRFINMEGVFFGKQSPKKWELKTRNPYIQIID